MCEYTVYNIANGIYPSDAGLKGVHNNGNGALMRILPVAIKYIDDDFREENVEAVASMTHGHKLSVDYCKIYIEMTVDLFHGMIAIEAYRDICLRFKRGCDRKLKRFLSGKLLTARGDQIDSSGYVLSTLEAAVWCYFTMIITKIQYLMLSILVMIRTQQLV
nr:ADP-ribosylglycohydrolase family protein [Sharpea azabuensis]